MKHRILLCLIVFIYAVSASSQMGIDSVLFHITQNNASIIAEMEYKNASVLKLKSGLTPDNPKMELEYFKGSPEEAGNQTDFAVIQSFDFPTSYGKKRQLSDERIRQLDNKMTSIRQEILLEAQLVCLELVYRNKIQLELEKRNESAEKWLNDFQKKMEEGEGNVLDVNKAQLQLIEINSQLQNNRSEINQLNYKLTELNGGIPIEFNDTVYSESAIVSDFETLKNAMELNDPKLKFLEQEKMISQKQLDLSKAMSLPKLEAGYHYQSILGQTFQGVHFGMTIPLWEDKNKVKANESILNFKDFEIEEHKIEHHYELNQKYEKQRNLKMVLNEYQKIFTSINNIELLDKSLSMGHISSIEYYMEINFYFEALWNYLRTEKEYYQTNAEILRFQL